MAKVPGIKCKFSLKTSQAVFEAGALRQVIAEVQDGFVVLRLRGLSTSFCYSVGRRAVYHLAAATDAERVLRARKAELGV
jgi:hypothetical protein